MLVSWEEEEEEEGGEEGLFEVEMDELNPAEYERAQPEGGEGALLCDQEEEGGRGGKLSGRGGGG